MSQSKRFQSCVSLVRALAQDRVDPESGKVLVRKVTPSRPHSSLQRVYSYLSIVSHVALQDRTSESLTAPLSPLCMQEEWPQYGVRVVSRNTFPTAAGLASSAAGRHDRDTSIEIDI